MIARLTCYFFLAVLAYTNASKLDTKEKLLCNDTNINQTNTALLAHCIAAKDCFKSRDFAVCPKKQVCCVKKREEPNIIDTSISIET